MFTILFFYVYFYPSLTKKNNWLLLHGSVTVAKRGLELKVRSAPHLGHLTKIDQLVILQILDA